MCVSFCVYSIVNARTLAVGKVVERSEVARAEMMGYFVVTSVHVELIKHNVRIKRILPANKQSRASD